MGTRQSAMGMPGPAVAAFCGLPLGRNPQAPPYYPIKPYMGSLGFAGLRSRSTALALRLPGREFDGRQRGIVAAKFQDVLPGQCVKLAHEFESVGRNLFEDLPLAHFV